jgi:hypothetical protein
MSDEEYEYSDEEEEEQEEEGDDILIEIENAFYEGDGRDKSVPTCGSECLTIGDCVFLKFRLQRRRPSSCALLI